MAELGLKPRSHFLKFFCVFSRHDSFLFLMLILFLCSYFSCLIRTVDMWAPRREYGHIFLINMNANKTELCGNELPTSLRILWTVLLSTWSLGAQIPTGSISMMLKSSTVQPIEKPFDIVLAMLTVESKRLNWTGFWLGKRKTFHGVHCSLQCSSVHRRNGCSHGHVPVFGYISQRVSCKNR